MSHNLKNLVELSQKIGKRIDYVQGGGGNISVKLSQNEMAVKASGFRLSDLSTEKGFVMVDHAKIKNFFESMKNNGSIHELSKKYDMILAESILKQISSKTIRPSMETGFHSLGAKYVLHSHSAYTNILNCSKEGLNIIAHTFKDAASIPYATPGVYLTLKIKNIINDTNPSIIFLENHGIIINAETAEEVYNIHESTNTLIKDRLNIKDAYPEATINELANNTFISTSPYIKKSLKKNKELIKKFHSILLFPDQIVYGQSVGFEKTNQISIDTNSGTIFYKTNKNEALAFEETFISWLFIIENITRLNMTLKTISKKDEDTILNMDSEKYRKNILI